MPAADSTLRSSEEREKNTERSKKSHTERREWLVRSENGKLRTHVSFPPVLSRKDNMLHTYTTYTVCISVLT